MIQKRGLHQIVSYVLYSFVMTLVMIQKRGLQQIVSYVLYSFVMILVMIQKRVFRKSFLMFYIVL